MSRFLLLTAAATLALAGCEPGEGNEAGNNQHGAGRTENGQFTVRAQGVDLKVNLPPPIRRMAEDNDYLYPGARNVRRGTGGEGQRFHSDDAPDVVARWYQDPARAGRFAIAAAERQGPARVLIGTARNGDALRIRLFPGADGGTDGTLVVTPRR